MTQNSNLNPDTGLPRRLSLGEVLGSIRLTPAEIAAFLNTLAADHFGGTNHNLGQALRDNAALVVDPVTYGYKPPEAVAVPGIEPYAPPTAQDASYAALYGPSTPRPPTTQTPASPMPTGAPDASTGEPPWMAAARAAGWNPTSQEEPTHATPPQPHALATEFSPLP